MHADRTWAEWASQRPARHWVGEGIIVAALALFGASAFFNAKFNASMATHEDAKIVMAVAGFAIAAMLALLAIGKRFLDKRVQRGAIRKLGLLIALLAAWEVWSAMGHISTNRGDTVSARVHEKQTYAANLSELPKLQAERDAIKARPSGQIEGAIAQLKARNPVAMEASQNCAKPERSPTCSRIASMQSELGAAKRKESLDTRIQAMMGANASASGHVQGDADPQAAAASTLFSLIGVHADSNNVAKLAPVLLALVLMLGGWWGIDLGFLVRGIHLGEPEAQKAEVTVPANVVPMRPANDGSHLNRPLAPVDDTAWARAVLKAQNVA